MEKPNPQSQTERFLITSKELSVVWVSHETFFHLFSYSNTIVVSVFRIHSACFYVIWLNFVTLFFMMSMWLFIRQNISWAFEKESVRVFHLSVLTKKSPISLFKKRKTQNWKRPGSWAKLLFVLSTFDPKTSWEERRCKPPMQWGRVEPIFMSLQFPQGGSPDVTPFLATRNMGILIPLF